MAKAKQIEVIETETNEGAGFDPRELVRRYLATLSADEALSEIGELLRDAGFNRKQFGSFRGFATRMGFIEEVEKAEYWTLDEAASAIAEHIRDMGSVDMATAQKALPEILESRVGASNFRIQTVPDGRVALATIGALPVVMEGIRHRKADKVGTQKGIAKTILFWE